MGFLILRFAGLVVAAGVCATIANDRSRRIAALRDSQEEVPRRLARVVEFRDRDTGGHVERMSEIAGLIARQMGLDTSSARRLEQASVMHDIGKVAIPDAILLKPGPLSPEERRVMEGHARAGFGPTAAGQIGAQVAANLGTMSASRLPGRDPRLRLGESCPPPATWGINAHGLGTQSSVLPLGIRLVMWSAILPATYTLDAFEGVNAALVQCEHDLTVTGGHPGATVRHGGASCG